MTTFTSKHVAMFHVSFIAISRPVYYFLIKYPFALSVKEYLSHLSPLQSAILLFVLRILLYMFIVLIWPSVTVRNV